MGKTVNDLEVVAEEVKTETVKRAKSVQHSMKVISGHLENIKGHLKEGEYELMELAINEAKAKYINEMYGL